MILKVWQNNKKWLVFMNIYALPSTLDLKANLLSQFIQRKENTSSNSILTEYSVFDWIFGHLPTYYYCKTIICRRVRYFKNSQMIKYYPKTYSWNSRSMKTKNYERNCARCITLKNHFLWFTLGCMNVMRIKIYKNEMKVKINYVL